MAGHLYIVGTPIGNLGDISPRALETLESVDFIAAEDTRVTVKLLNHFAIKKPMLSYHEHNRRRSGDEILSRLLSGETCALVTDAGMPAVSDPGRDLVHDCHEHAIDVSVVPGPSAFVAAVALSGMECGRFTFEGFLSVNKPGRAEHLKSLQHEKRTMVFYEAPHKLAATLKDMYSYFGDRQIAIIKEITKIHEQVLRTTLSQAAQLYNETAPKGEYVLVIEGEKETEKEEYTIKQAVEIARDYILEGLTPSAAAKLAAKITGIKKGEIYKAITGEN